VTFLPPEFAMDALKTIGYLLIGGILLCVGIIVRDLRS
jgi:hypothetical protein